MKKSLSVFLILYCVFSCSQNLIVNPSFELAKPDTCIPRNYENNFIAQNWFSASLGTPDFYTESRPDGFGLTNRNGSQEAKNGKSYVGIVLNEFIVNKPKSGEVIEPKGEYIEIKLASPLVKNNRYCFKMNISLSDYSRYAINEIDFAIVKEKIFQSNRSRIGIKNYTKLTNDTYFTDKTNWVTLCAEYLANGGEEYLIIGAFCEKYNVLDITTKQINNIIPYSYYYLDDISLTKVSGTDICKCNTEDPFSAALKNDFTLTNIAFETGNSKLIPTSFTQLDALRNYLLVHPNYKIELLGHTDNSGVEANNLKLSTERAKAVANYLIENGISKSRITFKGYGSSLPKMPNDTKENKTINRRVDFKIIIP